MASRRSEQQSEIRLRVMRLISEKPEMSSRQLADAVGISNGSAYYVLTALVEKGLVKLENFKKNPHKNRYAYLLTPKGIREKSILTHNFIGRKRKEYENLKREIYRLHKEVVNSKVLSDNKKEKTLNILLAYEPWSWRVVGISKKAIKIMISLMMLGGE